ncbi:hypothetical protein BDQ17DRAFT_1542214, partial [Cyathus striatus]
MLKRIFFEACGLGAHRSFPSCEGSTYVKQAPDSISSKEALSLPSSPEATASASPGFEDMAGQEEMQLEKCNVIRMPRRSRFQVRFKVSSFAKSDKVGEREEVNVNFDLAHASRFGNLEIWTVDGRFRECCTDRILKKVEGRWVLEREENPVGCGVADRRKGGREVEC